MGKTSISPKNHISYDSNINLYDAISISLSFVKGKLIMNILPILYVGSKNNIIIDNEKKKTIINTTMSKWYNKKFDGKIKFWRDIIYNKVSGDISFKLGNYVLRFNPISISSGGTDRQPLWENVQRVELGEPIVAFNPDPNTACAVNQIQGLLSYGPIDFSFNNKISNRPSIKIAILSPSNGIAKLLQHLVKLKKCTNPSTDKGFLRPYPGFEAVYKRGIDIPDALDSRFCIAYDDKKALSLSIDDYFANLKRIIDDISLYKTEFDILIVYIPDAFSKFREIKTENHCFDLHDSLKLYCADKGIKVQMLEERSIKFYDAGKVMWGLSTALYTKVNGLLWRPAKYDEKTAFVGISYAQKQDENNCYAIGCSQLFDSLGNGMRLLLKPIHNPQIIRRNPFMKSEDARLMLSKLRELYYDSEPASKLKRVVIHKTTFFTKEEIKGISQALLGIDDIELLQIQEYSHWRGIRYGDKMSDGASPYPIKRGTVIKLDDESFLLWTHGAVMHLELEGENRNYFKGGRGIPSPLLIKRFLGKAPIETVANEILMLTKMNWNSGDSFYKILPVTLDFSKTLSRMAKQKEALYNKPYDFRYFM